MDAYIIFETVRNQKTQRPVAILTELPFSDLYCHRCDRLAGCSHGVHVELWRSEPADHPDIEPVQVRDEDHATEMFAALLSAYAVAAAREMAERLEPRKPAPPVTPFDVIEL